MASTGLDPADSEVSPSEAVPSVVVYRSEASVLWEPLEAVYTQVAAEPQAVLAVV